MKKYFLAAATFLLCVMSFSSPAQSRDSLTMYRTFGGADFEYTKDTNTYYVSPKQVLEIMRDDQLAHAEFKKARLDNSVAGAMGFIGGSLILFPLVTAIVGGDPEWGMAAGGAALIVASIPFAKAFKRHAQSSVYIYNKKHTAFRPRTKFFFSGLGAKVLIKF